MAQQLTRKQFDILEALTTAKTALTQHDLERSTRHSPDTFNETMRELTDFGYVKDGAVTNAGINALEPYRVKRAVFIAAGFGSRLVPITFNTPKPLVRVHGVRIIDHLIDACLATGIDEIYIVRGYLAEQFDQLLYKYPMVKFLENPVYNEANNISSSLVACHMLSNAYVFEADLLICRTSWRSGKNVVTTGALLLRTASLWSKSSAARTAGKWLVFPTGTERTGNGFPGILRMCMPLPAAGNGIGSRYRWSIARNIMQ